MGWPNPQLEVLARTAFPTFRALLMAAGRPTSPCSSRPESSTAYDALTTQDGHSRSTTPHAVGRPFRAVPPTRILPTPHPAPAICVSYLQAFSSLGLERSQGRGLAPAARAALKKLEKR
jgi:hypothetical protein